MTSQSKNNRLLPLTVIEAAAGGDVEAINAVLKHYAGYIARLSIPFCSYFVSHERGICFHGNNHEENNIPDCTRVQDRGYNVYRQGRRQRRRERGRRDKGAPPDSE